METGSSFTVNALVESVKSASSATEAASTLIEFFDLEGNIDDDETEDGLAIANTLKSAAKFIQEHHALDRSSGKKRKLDNQ